MTSDDELRSQRRQEGPPRSDPGRAVAFSDAIIAIVITLLVLDLRPPETEEGDLLAGLLNEWPTYLAYAASYLYLAVIWMNHKAAFTRIGEMDVGLQWANLGILATLALVPWPTAIIAETARTGNLTDEKVAVGLYAMVGALLCLAWLVFFAYLAKHPELSSTHWSPRWSSCCSPPTTRSPATDVIGDRPSSAGISRPDCGMPCRAGTIARKRM